MRFSIVQHTRPILVITNDSMFNSKSLATALRARRLQLNYSQEYMAYKLNMSQNAYSKLELGNTAITVERLFEICEILAIDPLAILKPLTPVA